MNIKLNWLQLKNFKGIKDFKLETDGQNMKVFGNNALGKTSIIDAFMWLLFDKDSNDKADTNFTIKPQDENGKDMMLLQTLVEAELFIDGQPLKIKKSREEKWVKRQGASEKVFDGHTKFYWFNEVPLKAGEYKQKIDGLINENIFKMITNPLFFNTKLTWQERRNILLQICGDATDGEVITSDKSLTNLTKILSGRSIDDYKLVLADKLKGYKKERDNLPPRIDELTMSLPQEEPDYTEVETELKTHKDSLATVEFLMTNATNKANKLNEKYQELAKLKATLEEVKTKIKSELGGDRKKLIEEKTELQGGKYLLKDNIEDLTNQIEQCKRTINLGTPSLDKLRVTYNELIAKKAELIARQFIEPQIDDFKCPTCKQDLPSDSVETKIAEMRANFEKNKKSELEKVLASLDLNKNEGITTKSKVVQATENLSSLQKELLEKESHLQEIEKEISELEIKIMAPSPEPDYTKDKKFVTLSIEVANLQTELNKPIEDKSTELLQKKTNIQIQIDDLKTMLSWKTETEKKKARIEELKAEEKRISALIAQLDGQKYLLEQFTVAKVNLLEDSINSQFKHVKFKLFEENITNDGIKDTCIALVNTNGAYVKFEDGNSAGRVNAGLDIINSLTKFYDVSSIIWIDNRESVVKLADTDSQVISLVVSEKDKTLRVEVQE